MEQKFSKLRFGEFAKAATTGLIVGALALQPMVSTAATGSVQVLAGNAKWFLNTNITFNTTSSNWGFSEGSLGPQSDAFDGAISWLVSTGLPTAADGYRSPGGVVSITPNNPPNNPAVATTVLGNTQVMAGLNVSGQMYFSPIKAVARSILILQNPTGAPITVTVDNATNRGSDSNTFHQMTSSGDQTIDPTDNWFVSSQLAVPTPTDDPILTFAYQNAGAAVRGTASTVLGSVINPHNGEDNFVERYTVTVPAGQTRRLMMFVQMSDTVANALTDAPLFNSQNFQGTDYLQGLSQTELSEIVNWQLQPPVTVPTLGSKALIAFGLLIGFLGMRGRRFMRKA